METSQQPSRGANDARIPQDEEPSEAKRSTGWASAATERHNGQIGTGLLHNIEQRLGSIM
ncbi:MAG: hypothetical protein AAF641_02515 [Pseudomonadota bacterium]